jgi:hypothetical protein
MLDIPIRKLDNGVINNALQWLESYLQTTPSLETQETLYTNRKTLSFGYDYFKLVDNDRSFTEIPACLTLLSKELVEAFGDQYVLPDYKQFKNVIISIYYNDYMLEPHVDVSHLNRSTGGKPVNFYFGEHVLGVILKADKEGQLYIVKSPNNEKPHKQKPIIELNEVDALAYLLTGKLRYKPYYHGVSRVKDLRISVTYRTVEFFS